jgi:hypothetical protein
MTTLVYSGTLTVVQCWCGIRHAIPVELDRQARDNGKTVYCPLGHSWVYKETRADELERELRQAQQRQRATRDLLDAEQRSHSATRGHLTRTRKRAAAGVCPCCQRTFQNVARHVATKHPDFTP